MQCTNAALIAAKFFIPYNKCVKISQLPIAAALGSAASMVPPYAYVTSCINGAISASLFNNPTCTGTPAFNYPAYALPPPCTTPSTSMIPSNLGGRRKLQSATPPPGMVPGAPTPTTIPSDYLGTFMCINQ